MNRRAVLRLFIVASCVSLSAAAQEFIPPTSGFQWADAVFPFGSALQGKRIVVSPGHGWEGADGGYQRSQYKFDGCGTCDGIIEDVYNDEFCADHLIPMLREAGAKVYVAREFDRQTASVTVDDGDAGYAEVPTWNAGATAGLGWEGDYRTLNANIAGEATWTLDVPSEGDYWVQMRWAAGTNRCTDVRVQVEHAGGTAEFILDQQVDGSIWVPLARLHFNAGPAVVRMDHQAASGCYIIADAVRIGGGVDSASGLPWWKMSSLDWLSETGPSAVSGYNDVTVRPALANYLDADLFISFHGNGVTDTTAIGTATYRHNCGRTEQWAPLDPSLCDDPPGSAQFQYAVQDEIMLDLWDLWDPEMSDDGYLVANLGEMRVLETTPGFLVESAFFSNTAPAGGQTVSENQAMHDPRFRRIMARAIVRGVISVLNPSVPAPLDPPTHLVLKNNNNGDLIAGWRDVEGADGYRVYLAIDGRGYDSGTLTFQNPFTIWGLPEGHIVTMRVTTINAGGESTPSEAIAAVPSAVDNASRILLVNAYDRLDAWVREDVNHRDYVIEQGQAILDAGFPFDGASDEAVIEEDGMMQSYRMVDWVFGRESVEAETFSTQAQGFVLGLGGGNCTVASGTEIAWDLGNLGSAADQAFLYDMFGASYAADDAGTRQVSADPDGRWSDMAGFTFDNGSGGIYDARYPDVLTPRTGAESVLRYSTGGTAGIVWTSGSGRAVLLGFPIETIVDRAARAELMARIIDFCDYDDPWVVEEDGQADEAGEDIGFNDSSVGDYSAPDAIDNPDVFGDDVISVDSVVRDQADPTDPADSVGVDYAVTGDSQSQDHAGPGDSGAGDLAGPRDTTRTDMAGADARGYEVPILVDVSDSESDNGGHGGGGCSSSGAAAPWSGGVLMMLVAAFAAMRRFRVRAASR